MFWRDVNRSALSSLRSTEEARRRRMITALWDDAGQALETEDVLAPDGLSVNNYNFDNGRILTVIALPNAERVGEAYFCGMETFGFVPASATLHNLASDMLSKYKRGDEPARCRDDATLRYFVMQNEPQDGRADGTLLEFLSYKSSRSLGSGLEPSERAFVDAIRTLS